MRGREPYTHTHTHTHTRYLLTCTGRELDRRAQHRCITVVKLQQCNRYHPVCVVCVWRVRERERERECVGEIERDSEKERGRITGVKLQQCNRYHPSVCGESERE